MLKLTAVNRVLPALGESPVTSLAEQHPTVALIEAALQEELDSLLLAPRGLWFCTSRITLYPEPDGRIRLPGDTLTVQAVERHTVVAARGDFLWNVREHTFDWDRPVQVEIRSRWDFEELPESAALCVMYGALVNTYLKDLGVEQVVQAWAGYFQSAQAAVEAEDLRNRKLTTTSTRRFRNVVRAMRGA